MKVLVVSTWFPSASAPASGIFVSRDVELLRRSHEVDVLHLHARGAVGPEDVAPSVRRLAMSPSDPIDLLRSARTLRAGLERYDLVHTMSPSALLPFATVRVGIPWVHTEHWSAILDPSTVGMQARVGLRAAVRLMRRPDVLVAVSTALAEHLSSRLDRTVRVIPNAVDAPDRPVPRSDGDGPLRLVSVGGLIPRKGPGIAVETVAELRRRGHDARLTWVGEGPSRAEVAALAERLGVEGSVRLPGGMPPEGVLDELASSDLFLLPTAVETFGVSIAEALLSGRPVVVGSNGGQRDFVHEPDGLLVGERTGVAYADAVERSLELTRGRSAEDIARTLRRRFSAEARAAAYDSAYLEAIRAHD